MNESEHIEQFHHTLEKQVQAKERLLEARRDYEETRSTTYLRNTRTETHFKAIAQTKIDPQVKKAQLALDQATVANDRASNEVVVKQLEVSHCLGIDWRSSPYLAHDEHLEEHCH